MKNKNVGMMDMFAAMDNLEPQTATPDPNGYSPPPILAKHFPPVACAEAMAVTAYRGYAARSLMAFVAIVKESDRPELVHGMLYPTSYKVAARLVNEIVCGVASDRPAPTVESVKAAERFPDWAKGLEAIK